MAEHTPGPWRVSRQRIEYGPYVAGDGWCVAVVLRDPAEHEANARLIAAAPELLAALEAVVALDSARLTARDWGAAKDAAYSQARAAIAKAKGVQS